MTTAAIQLAQTSEKQAEAILERTRALEVVIQQLAIAHPSDIAAFFKGTKVYLYQQCNYSSC
jgi:hypothetical protein